MSIVAFPKSTSALQRIIRKWKQLSARSQLFIILFGISLIVLLATLTIFCLINEFQTDSIAIASKQLMLIQIDKQSKMVRNFYKKRTELYLRRGANSIINLNKLYKKLLNQDILTEQPYDCLKNFALSDQYQLITTFCYGIFGNQSTKQDYPFIRFTGILNQLVQLLDQNFTLFYTSTDESQFFSQYQGLQFIKYQPHNRPWYTQHFANTKIQAIDYSLPYINWNQNVYVMALLLNITDNYNRTIGLFGSEFNFVAPQSIYKVPHTNISIIDENGTIYLCKADLQTVSLFNNVSLTGFNDDDYQQIMNKYHKLNYTNNCTSISQNSKIRILCRYNKLNSQDQFITASKIKDSNLILIIQSDVIYDMDQVDEQVQDTIVACNNLFYNHVIDLVAFSVSIIGVSVIILMAIFRELHKITDFVNYRLRSQRYVKEILQIQLNKNQQSKNVMDKLEASFMNLIQHIEQNQYIKNPACRILQSNQNFRRLVQTTKFRILIYDCKQNLSLLRDESINQELEYYIQHTDSGQVTFNRNIQ